MPGEGIKMASPIFHQDEKKTGAWTVKLENGRLNR
jgi:hypothetical protein